MWPWEHAAVAYLLVSVAFRLGGWGPPDRTAALLAVFGTLFPDLVDKPLGWVFDVVPSGVSVAHSLFVATAVCLVVWLAGLAWNRERAALAFGLGYLSHLPADVFYPALTGGHPHWRIVLWPFVVVKPIGETDALPYVRSLFASFLELLAQPGADWFLVAEAMLLLAATSLWIADGHPGVPVGRRA